MIMVRNARPDARIIIHTISAYLLTSPLSNKKHKTTKIMRQNYMIEIGFITNIKGCERNDAWS